MARWHEVPQIHLEGASNDARCSVLSPQTLCRDMIEIATLGLHLGEASKAMTGYQKVPNLGRIRDLGRLQAVKHKLLLAGGWCQTIYLIVCMMFDALVRAAFGVVEQLRSVMSETERRRECETKYHKAGASTHLIPDTKLLGFPSSVSVVLQM